jgi:hypothetical protein
LKYLKKSKKLYCILGILVFGVYAYPQDCFNDIDLKRIPQKKIRNFITKQIDNHVTQFSDVEASWNLDPDIRNYHELESEYYIKDSLQKVWKLYKSVSPSIAWNGRIVSFGLLFSKNTNFLMYQNENTYKHIETGQVFYINLKVLRGMYNLAVGLEIIGIDTLNMTIRFSYIVGGKSLGEQTIHFISTEDGFTKIVHSTAFRSSSKFRDKFLYPFFHQKAIDEFHHNIVNNLISEGKLSNSNNEILTGSQMKKNL